MVGRVSAHDEIDTYRKELSLRISAAERLLKLVEMVEAHVQDAQRST
jgi:hypothetical protein